MPQYFKERGERLAELGYRIVPLPPGSKGPNRKGWPKFELTAPTIRQWAANGSAHDGVGILAATTPAIDVDILDPYVAQQMSDEIDRIFAGQSLMTRTGLAPKFLIPFRSDEPFRKLTSSVYTDGKHEHKVEILGDGQQWVAYHVHPDTGKPYQWFDGLSDAGISGVEHATLPCLTRSDAQRVIDAFEVLAAARVESGAWRAVTRTRDAAPAATQPGSDPFAAHAAPVTDLTRAQVEWVVSRIANIEDDYDRWFGVLCATHHQLGEEGIEVARAYSEKSSKHVAEIFEAKYASLGSYTGPMTTLRTFLPETGQPPKEEHKPRASGPDNPFAVHEWADYKQNYLATPWIIKGVLPQAEVGILYGQSGSGKTFFVLDMAATIARGAEWRGRKVSDCRVVYVAAEAREGIKKRMDAYDQHVCADGVRPAIIASAPNLLSTDTVKLGEAIGKAGLIILDTMAASHSGDENSAKDMGLFLAACKDLSHATGAMVLAVHHTGKEESKGMRGSSALFAGADFVMEVFKNEKEHGASLSKSRDDVTGTSFSFVLKRVVVGHDEDGDEVTTCVVEPIQKEVHKVTKKPKKLANTSDTRYDFSREMLALIEDLAYKSNTGKVHKDQILEQLLQKYPGKLKRNLVAVLLRLEQLGAVHQTLDWYTVDEDEIDLG
jgi:hypothetical protein